MMLAFALLFVPWILLGGGAFAAAAMAGPITAILGGILWILPVLLAGPLLMGTQATIRAGDDGFEVRWLGRRRYVAYRDVASASIDQGRMVFTLRNGKQVFVQLAHRKGRYLVTDDPRGTPVARRIDEGLAHARVESETARDEEELARGKRTPAAWLAAIEERAQPAAEYRGAALDRSALVRVATDGSADGSARGAAALLLRASGMNDEEGRAIAEAARGTVHPRVRVALEAVADPATVPDVVRARVRAIAT
jgi:hypothetical protein